MKPFKDSIAFKIIKERWAGQDMEEYFKKKSDEFYMKLLKEVSKSKKPS